MTRLIPRPRYLLVFAVRGKRKVGTLYSPTKGSLADYNAVLPVYIAEMGAECRIAREGATVGVKGFVHDAYELDTLPEDLWETYRQLLPPAVVREIEQDAHDGDGLICGNITHENSIFALEVDGGEAGHDRQADGRGVDAHADA